MDRACWLFVSVSDSAVSRAGLGHGLVGRGGRTDSEVRVWDLDLGLPCGVRDRGCTGCSTGLNCGLQPPDELAALAPATGWNARAGTVTGKACCAGGAACDDAAAEERTWRRYKLVF